MTVPRTRADVIKRRLDASRDQRATDAEVEAAARLLRSRGYAVLLPEEVEKLRNALHGALVSCGNRSAWPRPWREALGLLAASEEKP